MDAILRFFGSMLGELGALLDTVQFNIGGNNVSWLILLLSFVALSIVISVFWKGARK